MKGGYKEREREERNIIQQKNNGYKLSAKTAIVTEDNTPEAAGSQEKNKSVYSKKEHLKGRDDDRRW